MSIQFEVRDDRETVVVTASGHIAPSQVAEMRQQLVAVSEKTGFRNYLFDTRGVLSLDNGNTSSIADMGYKWSEVGFSVWNNTAVLLPHDDSAREQVRLLHTIEINRGRGVIQYVDSIDDAYGWFDEMTKRMASGLDHEPVR